MVSIVRPRAILLTGTPGSGKSTLAREVAKQLRVPFIARDDIRGGLVFTAGAWTDRIDHLPTSAEAVSVFLQTVESLLAAHVSCVVEYVWRSDQLGELDRLLAIGDCVIIMVTCDRAMERVVSRNQSDRLISNPAVLAAAGVDSVEAHTAAVVQRMSQVESEMMTTFDLPTLVVDTTETRTPDLDAIIGFATAEH